MRKLVLSGINIYKGGTLTIYKDFIRSLLAEKVNLRYEIVCFVHKKELFSEYKHDVTLIELPKSRKNYLFRLYYEWHFFKKYSQKNDVYVWISMQDITPKVKCEKLFTYCHNPMMFYKMSPREIKYSFKLFLFSKFYKKVYKANIKNNTYVIVQQNWIGEEFEKQFGIRNILISRPINEAENITYPAKEGKNSVTTFIYPSQATFFKNFEIVCEAAKQLGGLGYKDFQVYLTIDGSESKYSKIVYEKYKNIEQIKWIGFISKEKLNNLYSKSDCMIFPSKLETWGLPISEFKATGRPIMLADLPYAHETIGDYDNVAFFDPDDATELSTMMKNFLEKDFSFFSRSISNGSLFLETRSWKELINTIIDD